MKSLALSSYLAVHLQPDIVQVVCTVATTGTKSYIDLGCGGSKFYIAVSTLLLDAVKLFSIKNICIFKYMSQTNRESSSNQSRFWGLDLGRSNDQVTTAIMIIFSGSTLIFFFF